MYEEVIREDADSGFQDALWSANHALYASLLSLPQSRHVAHASRLLLTNAKTACILLHPTLL